MITSKYFSPSQLKSLIKTGDVILPGTDKSPSFSQTGCIGHIDRMAAYLTEDDLNGLRLVLSVFRWLPNWLISLLMSAATNNCKFPGVLGAGLRLLEIGLKGATMSLYYSNLTGPGYEGPKVFDVIGYDAKVVVPEGDEAQEATDDYGLDNPTPKGVARIYERARAAQPGIAALGLKKRLDYIAGLKAAVIARREEIVERIQADTGKSRTDALTSEIFGVLDHLDYLQKHAPKILADRKAPTPMALMGKKSKIYFEPLGTVLVISPWNYPFYQAIVPITSAFVVGNAVVFKPSKETPLKGLCESLFAEVGFEPDWVQIVYGPGGAIGDLLIDQRPDKIFFIGSAATGQRIMERAAKQLIPVELELGGKDPMIVFEDANLERAAAGAVWGAFTNTGQSCTSVEKLYVQESVYDRFRDILVREVLSLTQKLDSDGSADIGPMTTQAQVKVIAEQVADTKAKGAVFLTGDEWDGQSEYIPPMIIEGSTEEMLLNREETFGPLLPIFKFRDEAEVVALANDTEFGLSASVWSDDIERADRVARAIVTGNVSINNVMLTEGNHALPFGGAKKSGIGRYKGEFGLYCFANIKSVLIDKNSPKLEANWFPYTPRKYRLFSELTANLYTPGLASLVKGALAGMKLERYAKKLGKGARR